MRVTTALYLVRGEVVEQLGDLVVEELLPREPGPGHAVVEVVRLLLDDELKHSLLGVQWLSSG